MQTRLLAPEELVDRVCALCGVCGVLCIVWCVCAVVCMCDA